MVACEASGALGAPWSRHGCMGSEAPFIRWMACSTCRCDSKQAGDSAIRKRVPLVWAPRKARCSPSKRNTSMVGGSPALPRSSRLATVAHKIVSKPSHESASREPNSRRCVRVQSTYTSATKVRRYMKPLAVHRTDCNSASRYRCMRRSSSGAPLRSAVMPARKGARVSSRSKRNWLIRYSSALSKEPSLTCNQSHHRQSEPS